MVQRLTKPTALPCRTTHSCADLTAEGIHILLHATAVCGLATTGWSDYELPEGHPGQGYPRAWAPDVCATHHTHSFTHSFSSPVSQLLRTCLDVLAAESALADKSLNHEPIVRQVSLPAREIKPSPFRRNGVCSEALEVVPGQAYYAVATRSRSVPVLAMSQTNPGL